MELGWSVPCWADDRPADPLNLLQATVRTRGTRGRSLTCNPARLLHTSHPPNPRSVALAPGPRPCRRQRAKPGQWLRLFGMSEPAWEVENWKTGQGQQPVICVARRRTWVDEARIYLAIGILRSSLQKELTPMTWGCHLPQDLMQELPDVPTWDKGRVPREPCCQSEMGVAGGCKALNGRRACRDVGTWEEVVAELRQCGYGWWTLEGCRLCSLSQSQPSLTAGTTSGQEKGPPCWLPLSFPRGGFTAPGCKRSLRHLNCDADCTDLSPYSYKRSSAPHLLLVTFLMHCICHFFIL